VSRRFTFIAVVGASCAGCATTNLAALQDAVERHARIDPAPGPPAPVEPAMVDFPLVNPLSCAAFVAGGGGSNPVAAIVLGIGCACVFIAVDVVAMPVQLPIRQSQAGDLKMIAESCEVGDPVRQVADRAVARFAAEFGFRTEADQPFVLDPESIVLLEVKTERFTWSDGFRWTGKVAMRQGRGEPFWKGSCDVRARPRKAREVCGGCAEVREDVEALAEACAVQAAAELRQALGPPPGGSAP